MTVVDTLVFGVLAIGLILGLIRGLISQVTGLVGLMGGFYLAWRYHDGMRDAVIDPLFTTDHNDKIAFGVILLVSLLVTALFGWLLGLLFDKMSLGAYDRLMGGLFGIVKSGLICAGIMLTVVVLIPTSRATAFCDSPFSSMNLRTRWAMSLRWPGWSRWLSSSIRAVLAIRDSSEISSNARSPLLASFCSFMPIPRYQTE